jgi:translation initiation factor 1
MSVGSDLSVAEVCQVCGLPKDLCVCEELERQQSRIVVRLEMRRFRKPTTIIEGMDPKHIDLSQLASSMKRKFACGGTAKEGVILLQGDHKDEVKDYLGTQGFGAESIEVQ